MNTITLFGRVTRMGDLKTTQTGNNILNISVVDDEYDYKTKQKVGKFYSVVIFGKVAETCKKFLTVGQSVYITGHLTYWTDREEKKVYQIQTEKIEFGAKPRGKSIQPEMSHRDDMPKPSNEPLHLEDVNETSDEDVPF